MSKKHKKNKHKKEGKHLGRICCDNQAPDRSGAISISCGLALKEAKKQKHQNIPSELRLDMYKDPGFFFGVTKSYQRDQYVGMP